MGNFNDMQPCAHCGQVRNTPSMGCTNGLWFCAQCARDHSHLARLAEAHEPEPTPSCRLPSGWWILPAAVVSALMWRGIIELFKWWRT